MHSLSSTDEKISEFVHRMDWPVYGARMYHYDKPRKPYFQIDGRCGSITCHDLPTYMEDNGVKIAIKTALQAIIDTPL